MQERLVRITLKHSTCSHAERPPRLGILYNNLALQEARERQWDQAIASFTQALDCHRVVGNEEGLRRRLTAKWEVLPRSR